MTTQVLDSSAVWGVLLTLAAFGLGVLINKRTGKAIFNPLLLGTAFVIVVLSVLNIPYDTYAASASPISYLLLPATVSLAVPLYEKWDLLCKNLVAIVAGVLAGVMASLFSVLALALLLDLNHEQYITLLPKSVTTAISMDVSRELGGIATPDRRHCDFDRHCGRAGGGNRLQGVPHYQPHCQRHRHWYGVPRRGHQQGAGNRRSGRRDERPFRCCGRYHDRRALPAVLGIDSLNTEGPPAHHLVCGARAGCLAAGRRETAFLQVFCPAARAALAARRVLYYNKNRLFVCAKYREKSAAPPGNRGLECAALTERGS